MKALFLLIDLQGGIGGAQKRYVSIANYLLESRKDVKVVMNNALYEVFAEIDLIAPHENLIILNLGKRKALLKRTNSGTKNQSQDKSWVLRTLGRMKFFAKTIRDWVRFSIYFFRLYRQFRFRVIYSVWHGSMFVWPWKFVLPFQLIMTYNDSTVSYLKRGMENWFRSEYMALRFADKIDFLSASIRTSLEKEIGPIDDLRVRVSPCSFVDTDKFKKASETLYDTVFLSRLNHWKSPLLYLEVIRILNERYDTSKSWQHVLIGAGDLSQQCKDYAVKNDLSNLMIIGEVNQPQHYLSRNRLFFSLQKIENYPSQSMLEAMSSENAIIATDVGETRRLIDDSVGTLVKHDAEEIAKAAYSFLINQSVINEMGFKSRQRVIAEHSIEHFMAYFCGLLDETKTLQLK